MIPVRVREENMAQRQFVFREAIEHRLRVNTGIEQRRFARGGVPREQAIHGQPVASGGKDAEVLPALQIIGGGQPAVRDALQFFGVQADERGERGQIDFPRALAGVFECGEFRFGNGGSVRGGRGGRASHFTRFADDVAKMVFELHGGDVSEKLCGGKRAA